MILMCWKHRQHNSGLILGLRPGNETSLQSNAVAHWLGPNLESALQLLHYLINTDDIFLFLIMSLSHMCNLWHQSRAGLSVAFYLLHGSRVLLLATSRSSVTWKWPWSMQHQGLDGFFAAGVKGPDACDLMNHFIDWNHRPRCTWSEDPIRLKGSKPLGTILWKVYEPII